MSRGGLFAYPCHLSAHSSPVAMYLIASSIVTSGINSSSEIDPRFAHSRSIVRSEVLTLRSSFDGNLERASFAVQRLNIVDSRSGCQRIVVYEETFNVRTLRA